MMDEKVQSLLKRIRELKEICNEDSNEKSLEDLNQIPPAGYTPARWQLALQSFSERLQKRNNHANKSNKNHQNNGDETDWIKFGPEWDLKCAQLELENLLKQQE